eukprot:CAMPEP_0177669258 /NCGR_PEP_ID=MMETSP0447-20121125/23325_1 /TAXON_ID=0 /ORGANISM="Stygamoeba regulata, Strain BSH-02190019" /LENGTH=35 /DNA_ID= /DNA_START= /DNA_END= /DNA_ORIENTATION=
MLMAPVESVGVGMATSQPVAADGSQARCWQFKIRG